MEMRNMGRIVIFIIMLVLSSNLIAQTPTLTESAIFAEVGRLHMQVSLLTEYIRTLEAKVHSLEMADRQRRGDKEQ